MTTYHLLSKPIQRNQDGSITWMAHCGIKVSLKKPCRPGDQVQTADKRGNEIIECAGCYAGEDSDPMVQPQQQAAPDPLDARTRPGAPPLEHGDDAILGEEIDEYPE